MESQVSQGETIAAICTALGEAALAVIRISGPGAFEVADGCFQASGTKGTKPSRMPSHTIQHGHVVRNGAEVDEVMLTAMRAPRTFTREDVVEIGCHGGVLVTQKVLEAILGAGARLAEPGEFTRRAFLNGRIDLTQAEAVLDVIHSRTGLALSAAREQLRGALSRQIEKVRDDLMRALAHVEAHIDFPEEDISPDTLEQLLGKLGGAREFIGRLLATADEGRVLRRGVKAAIVGRPNAGKSSLLNRLLGHERAIVSPIPGTTRDTIEETANVRGIPIVFIDTAGIHAEAELIEAEGVRRSKEALAEAELILHVLDGSLPPHPEDLERLRELDGRARLVVVNKGDLPGRLGTFDCPESQVARISCQTGAGLEELKEKIRGAILGGKVNAEMWEVMINSRHQRALERARAHLEMAESALRAGDSLELAAMDLRIATGAVGEVVGKTTTEDLLDSIFSQFCLGK